MSTLGDSNRENARMIVNSLSVEGEMVSDDLLSAEMESKEVLLQVSGEKRFCILAKHLVEL